MKCRDTMRSPLVVALLAAAGIIELPGCGSSSNPPIVADASPGSVPDSSISADASSARDTGEVTSFCTGPATGALIDDMSGTSISLTPPPCGTKGAWVVDPLPLGTISTPAGDSAVLSSCGSLCQSMYSPMPPGFPGAIAMDDGGALDAAAELDGGTSGPQAMCVAGQTGADQYSGAGMVLLFGFSGAVPAGGPAVIRGAVSGVTTVPPPALIDASQYTGIQFWLWVSPSTVAAVESGLAVQLVDESQLLGGGTCDPNADDGSRACGAAGAALASTPAATSQAAGPLYADDGSKITALVGGWQLVRAPWGSFTSNPYWGGDNETAVDPKTLAALEFYVMQASPSGPTLSFDFCIYQLSFYK